MQGKILKVNKNLGPGGEILMYPNKKNQQSIEDFILPFGGELNPNNRWVHLAELIPWEELEEEYASNFSNVGQQAKPFRMALGALIIKEKCGYTDRETVEQITENPYLQYFIGLKEFQTEPPFDSSLMVHFRKRLNMETIQRINEQAVLESDSKEDQDDDDSAPPAEQGPKPSDQEDCNEQSSDNKGKLIIDGSCAPADIRYPTDVDLLNESREKLETIIDTLHEPLIGLQKKPKTYRKKARKLYLKVAKMKKPSKKAIRKAIKQQLGYIIRNLKTIEKLLADERAGTLSTKQKQELSVIYSVYEQQKTMYERKENRIEDRIVSISQPHVRPIVRGKASGETEFGAKIVISVIDGYTFLEKLGWDNFHEGATLQESVENYYARFGSYPQAVIADKIYRTQENRQYCKSRGIRLSGPPLGRPGKDHALQKELERKDALERNTVEGAIGTSKRRYGLDKIMAKLQETSETVIALKLMVQNLDRKLARIFCIFLEAFIFAFQRPEKGSFA